MNAEEGFVLRERKHVFEATGMIEELLARPSLSRFDVISLGTLLQNVYTGIERILRFDLERLGVHVDKSETWHKDLLVTARREHLLDDSRFDAFGVLLAFRHVQVHGYGHMLDESRLRSLALPVPALVRGYLAGRKA